LGGSGISRKRALNRTGLISRRCGGHGIPSQRAVSSSRLGGGVGVGVGVGGGVGYRSKRGGRGVLTRKASGGGWVSGTLGSPHPSRPSPSRMYSVAVPLLLMNKLPSIDTRLSPGSQGSELGLQICFQGR